MVEKMSFKIEDDNILVKLMKFGIKKTLNIKFHSQSIYEEDT